MILTLSLLMFFVFGFYRIGKFVTADEHYWVYERIPQYFQAIRDVNIKKTRINDKPGVSLALVSGIGLFWEKNPQNHFEKAERIDDYDTENSEKFYSSFRIPLLVFNLLLAVYLFWVIGKILKNNQLSALAVSFTILSPVILGISRIINPDALLWSTSASAIFSFFALVKTEEKKFILLTGFFTGLALLSKYTANILFVFYFLFILLEYLMNHPKLNFTNPQKTFGYFKKNIFWMVVIFFLSCLFLGFFMPAALKNLKIMYVQTFGSKGIREISFYFVSLFSLILLDAIFLKSKVIAKFKTFLKR